VHFVWSTWERQPLITTALMPKLYASIAHHSAELGAKVIAVGGICDHVHLLVRLPPTISIAEFIGRVKGASSHFVTHLLRSPESFKWQGAYGAFTVSRRDVPAVRDCVLNQEIHHAVGTTHASLEQTEAPPDAADAPES